MKKTHFLITVLSLSVLGPGVLASDHPSGVKESPDQILKILQEGNEKFATGKSSRSHQDANRRKELTSGQQPKAIILSCSDSRVPPEHVFDQGLGDIFTIRVAGNVLGAASVASIEYAVEHLGSKLIVVMGHESCGAVKAALGTPASESAGSPDLDNLLSAIRPGLESQDRSIASKDKMLRKPVISNVNFVADRLMTRSKIVRKHVESGQVKIARGIYSLETGKVEFWDASTQAKNESSKAEESKHSKDPHSKTPTEEPKREPAQVKSEEHAKEPAQDHSKEKSKEKSEHHSGEHSEHSKDHEKGHSAH